MLRRFAGQGGDAPEDTPAPSKPARPALSSGRARTSFQIPRPQCSAKCAAANGRLEIRLPRPFGYRPPQAGSRRGRASEPDWLGQGPLPIARAASHPNLLGPLQQRDDGRKPLHVAARRAFAHLLPPAGDPRQCQVGMGVAHPRHDHKQPIVSRAARRPLQHCGGQQPVADIAPGRALQLFHRPALADPGLDQPGQVIPGHGRPVAAHQRQPAIGRGLELAE